MRRIITFSGLILAFLICSTAIFAQKTIAPKELKKIMNSKDVVIISARKAEDYNKVHINNAVNVYPNDLYMAGDVKGLLKSADELAKIFGNKGITCDKTIVVYDGGKYVAAGRLFWILDYLGCDNVKVLNGGLPAWRKNRLPLTKNPTTIKKATFNAVPDASEIVTEAYVKSHLNDPGVVIVDVRSKDEFDGLKGEANRKGHVPGAINLEYKTVLKDNGAVKNAEALSALFKDAGITPDKEVILYCETSARAGIVYLALKYVLAYPDVKVYDGAFYEWAAHAGNPVE